MGSSTFIGVNRIPEWLPDKTYVVLDVELFGAERHRLHRPTGEFACMSWATKDQHGIITSENIVGLMMGVFKNCVLVMHNAQFDLQHIRRWANVQPQPIWCTMIMERILYSGYYDSFALKDLVRRYLDTYMDKEVRDQFKSATELTDELIEYSIRDAVFTYQVFEKQMEKVKENRWAFKIWKQIDMPSVWAYLDFQGFRLDVDKWVEIAKENERIAEELKESFDFNPASPKQVKESLKKLGFDALPSTGVKVLEKYIKKSPNSKAAEVASDVLNYRKVAKLANTYGMNFIEKYLEDEHGSKVIHCNMSVTGASSGRSSSSNPNMQNIPVRDNPVFREPWIARPYHKLLIADYSSQEPRITAQLTGDEHLIEIFRSGKDPYIEIAKRVHGLEITKDDPIRQDIKTDILAAIYGQRPHDKESDERLWRFNEYFYRIRQWCDAQQTNKQYAESVMGRRLWVNPYSSQYYTNNLNHPHQSTAADMMKMAIVKMHQGWKFNCPFGVVIPVHDEVILDVPEKYAEEIAEFVEDCMVSVAEKMCPTVPFVAEVHICDSWSEK